MFMYKLFYYNMHLILIPQCCFIYNSKKLYVTLGVTLGPFNNVIVI